MMLNKQRIIEEAEAVDIEVVEHDMRDINSDEMLLCMLEPYFVQALRAGYFTIGDMNDIFVGFRDFYTRSIAEYRQPSEYRLSDAEWITAASEREMIHFLSTFMVQSYLDKEYAMDFVRDCATDWGPKAIQILRPECVEAHEEERITQEDFAAMSLEQLTTAIDENRYPRDSSYRNR